MRRKSNKPQEAEARGPGFLQFTKDGKPVGPPIPQPPGANDLRLRWRLRPPPPVITGAQWTRNGRPLGPPIPVPTGANDARFRLT